MDSLRYILYVALLTGMCFGNPVKNFRFLSNSTVVMAYFGSDVDIDCGTNEKGASVTLWKRVSPLLPNHYLKLKPDGNKIVKEKNGKFTINRVDKNDALSYRCKAKRSGVHIQKDFSVVINNVVPGVVIKPAHYQSALTGTNVTFLCESQAGTFEWLKVNTMLQDGTETTTSTHKIDQNNRNRIVASFSNGMVTSVLTISNITTSDSGIYECVLRVIHHQHPIEKNARLYVHAPTSPVIDYITPSKVVNAGDNQILQCRASGFPEAKITWYKNGSPLKVCNKNSDSICSKAHYIWREDRHDLQIPVVNYRDDNGVFTCVAENRFGRATADIKLSVLTAPVLDKDVQSVVVARGKQLVPIQCRVKYSNPIPKISWNMQFLKPRCFDPNYFRMHVSVCEPKENRWLSKPQLLSGAGYFSPSNLLTPTMRSSYIPKFFSLAYYRCTATNSKGSDSMVFLFRRYRY